MNTSSWYTPIPVGTVTAEQRALINREIAQRMIANRVLVQPGHRQPSRRPNWISRKPDWAHHHHHHHDYRLRWTSL
jgi:hypothetical protein